MFKTILAACIWAMVLVGGGGPGWSDDIDDRFIDPDISTAKTIFIDVKDVSLMEVLKIISKQSGLSFIAAQDVADKKLTLYLNKIPLNQALLTVLDANGLTYETQDDSNVMVVKAKYKTEKTKITRVYQLKYATVSTSKLNSTLDTSGGAVSSGGFSSGSAGAAAATPSSGASSSSGGLEQAIQDALSPDGKVIEDPRTNSLIITDVPGQFDIIESTINKLDVSVPQILIEVEMLDVSKSTADQLGVKYGANPLTFLGGSKVVNYPFSTATVSGETLATTGGSSSSQTSPRAYFPGEFSASGMTAELNFLTTKTDARTLARPRILTLNNQTAQIEISTDQAISIQQVSSSTTTGSSTNSVAPERYTTGVILKVTPQANLSTREITMAVSPKVIDVILSQVQQSGTGAAQIYDPETRGSDSILKLRDGQSMVIGGLMTNQNNNTVTKLPILGDLPVVGSMFRSSNKTKAERELLIFLTPHIIDDTNQSTVLQNTTDRSQDINNTLNTYEK